MGHLVRQRFAKLRKGTHDRTSPAAVARRDLAERCLALRREGLTNSEIAARLCEPGGKLNEQKVGDLILARLKERERPALEDIRTEELDRLDRLYNRAHRLAMGDANRDRVPALGMALKALERRAALLGLDAPKQVDVKDERQHTAPPAAVADIVAELAQEAEREGAGEGGAPGTEAAGAA